MLDPSDLELLEGFEFDSDLDVPPEDVDTRCQCHPPIMDQDEPAVDPWNAVCVVGPLGFTLFTDHMLSLQVGILFLRMILRSSDRDDPAALLTTHQRDSYLGKDSSLSSQLPI